MAIRGSSDGQEVLRRGAIEAQSNTWTSFKFDGTSPTTGTSTYTVPSNHIVTILSIIWCETGNAAEVFQLSVEPIYLLVNQALAARGTFIWSERLNLEGGEKLQTNFGSAANIDIFYSYLDQDWS